ncbi:hypothetical protein CKAH01_16131 [Colletotrichum kahawae]|uniref:Uncharacterized protein n=1 Tax=Colletotrichum kahawae TaxID=34407 RepID=A0AAE0D964_COLKA|nr:hypothetical protein CKAH01_16131 [Colletotrichum kahawae]
MSDPPTTDHRGSEATEEGIDAAQTHEQTRSEAIQHQHRLSWVSPIRPPSSVAQSSTCLPSPIWLALPLRPHGLSHRTRPPMFLSSNRAGRGHSASDRLPHAVRAVMDAATHSLQYFTSINYVAMDPGRPVTATEDEGRGPVDCGTECVDSCGGEKQCATLILAWPPRFALRLHEKRSTQAL